MSNFTLYFMFKIQKQLNSKKKSKKKIDIILSYMIKTFKNILRFVKQISKRNLI